jgi:hypothetical protein
MRSKLFLCNALFVMSFLSLAFILAGCNPITTTTSVMPTTGSMAWSPDSDCSICHDSEVLSMANPDWLGYAHEALGLECLSCHPVINLQEIHKSSTDSTPLVIDTTIGITEYSDLLCLTCHGSYTGLIALTKDSQAFLTPEGKVVNPHDIHQGEHVKCYKCHQMHRKSPGMSINYCYGCHHTGFEGCEKCHISTKKNSIKKTLIRSQVKGSSDLRR